MYFRRLLLAVAVAALLGACGVGGARTEKVDYRQQYIDMWKPSQCAVERYDQALARWKGTSDLDAALGALKNEVQPAMKGLSVALTGFYEQLVQAEWPENSQDDVDAVAKYLSSQARVYGLMSEATNMEQVSVLNKQMPQLADPAGVFRAKLGVTTVDIEAIPCI